MANTRQQKPDIDKASFFLIGDSGSGKTRLAGSFPNCYIFDFDKGTASLSDVDVEYDTFKDAPPSPKGASGIKPTTMKSEGIYQYGKGYLAFLEKINKIGDDIDKGECPFKTLVLDSATMLSDLVMNYVLHEDGKPGTGPQIQHWGRQIELLRTVFDQFTSWPVTKIITAHIQRNTNDLLQTTEMLPLLTGKFAGKASIYFDEVYFLEYETVTSGNAKTNKRVIRTQSTALRKAARSRFQVPDGTEATYEAIRKALEKNA